MIAAGGDGTYNEVAQWLAHTSVPMAILPLGTTSVLAREIGIGTDIEKAIDLAVRRLSRTVHMGRLTDGRDIAVLPPDGWYRLRRRGCRPREVPRKGVWEKVGLRAERIQDPHGYRPGLSRYVRRGCRAFQGRERWSLCRKAGRNHSFSGAMLSSRENPATMGETSDNPRCRPWRP
ncbi:MAG: acylglycerol kinase family protein [Desulfobacterales bacterium]|nr:acylglycerol kinase family protein [Desulfobacterales bacterium]